MSKNNVLFFFKGFPGEHRDLHQTAELHQPHQPLPHWTQVRLFKKVKGIHSHLKRKMTVWCDITCCFYCILKTWHQHFSHKLSYWKRMFSIGAVHRNRCLLISTNWLIKILEFNKAENIWCLFPLSHIIC